MFYLSILVVRDIIEATVMTMGIPTGVTDPDLQNITVEAAITMTLITAVDTIHVTTATTPTDIGAERNAVVVTDTTDTPRIVQVQVGLVFVLSNFFCSLLLHRHSHFPISFFSQIHFSQLYQTVQDIMRRYITGMGVS